MQPSLRYAVISLSLTGGLIASLVVAALVPSLRPPAIYAGVVLILARLVLTVLRIRADRRRIAELKAANDGMLPITSPTAFRRRTLTVTAATGGLGVLILGAAVLVDDDWRLITICLGGAFLFFALVFGLMAWSLFKKAARPTPETPALPPR